MVHHLVSFHLQEFFDMWPILMGEAAPYDGPKTPDGRVRKTLSTTTVIVIATAL